MNYYKIYASIVTRAQQRMQLTEKNEIHHIVPVSLGGNNTAENLVKLTLREHFVCHLILARIYGGPMLRAAFLMSHRRCYTSRVYARIKEQHIKENMMGDNNPSRRIPCTDTKREVCGQKSKDRKWLNNGDKSCMAKGEAIQELLSNGWQLGRLRTESLITGVKKGGNMTGGHNKGTPCSEEQKIAISAKLTGNIPWNKGKKLT